MSLEQILDHDIVPNNLWQFYFTDFPDLQYLTEDVNLPLHSLDVETDAVGVKHYTGFSPVESFTVTWRESAKRSVYKYLNEWMEEVFDSRRQVFNVGNHSREAILSVHKFDDEGNEIDLVSFSYHHVMIQGISDISWAYGSGDPIKLTGTFYCDWIEQELFV